MIECAGELLLGLGLGVLRLLHAVDEDFALRETDFFHGLIIGTGASRQQQGQPDW